MDAAAAATSTAAPLGPLQFVTRRKLTVARQYVGMAPTAAVMEEGFVGILAGYTDFFTGVDIGDTAVRQFFLYRLLNLPAIAAQKALSIDRAFVLGVLAAVNEERHCDLRTLRYHSESSRTCFSV